MEQASAPRSRRVSLQYRPKIVSGRIFSRMCRENVLSRFEMVMTKSPGFGARTPAIAKGLQL